MKIVNLINNGLDQVIENGLVRIGKSTLLLDVEYSGPISFGDFCRVRRTKVGKYSGSGNNCEITDCEIGAFCSFGENITFNAGKHPKDWLTTSLFATNPGFWSYATEYAEAEHSTLRYIWRSPVIIGNDVWIGNNVVILTGVTVGDGAILGANSVVTKDIPPYSIAVGSPAKVKAMRFDDNTIQRLLHAQWWNNSIEFLLKLPVNDVEKTLMILEENQLLQNKNI